MFNIIYDVDIEVRNVEKHLRNWKDPTTSNMAISLKFRYK
jgi:hypothetical protein